MKRRSGRNWGWIFLGLLSVFPALAENLESRGLCTQDFSTPGLPKAVCSFPSCPTGGDCMPPTIDKSNPAVEFLEPLLRWQDDCKDAVVSGSCWEVYIDFKLKLGANDPSGIGQIGVNMYYELNAQRYFKRYWGNATVKDQYGRYDMTSSMIVHVPPGQRLELGVYELCAKDKSGNEGCVLPAKARNLALSPAAVSP